MVVRTMKGRVDGYLSVAQELVDSLGHGMVITLSVQAPGDAGLVRNHDQLEASRTKIRQRFGYRLY
mgnify:CR=1 FL=1